MLRSSCGIFGNFSVVHYKRRFMTQLKFMSALFGMVLLGASCQNTSSSAGADTTDTSETPLVGGDQDEHGCKASAGQTWSNLKQSCIRVFDDGVRLNPTTTQQGDAIISAFVVYDAAGNQVELFLPESNTGSLLLDKNAEELYQSDVYVYNPQDSTITIDGQLAYAPE